MKLRYGHDHYVPVLRWKAAEVGALSKLSKEVRDGITPLMELCPSAFTPKKSRAKGGTRTLDPEDIAATKVTELAVAVGRNPVFVDLQHLPNSLICANGKHIWDAIRQQGLTSGLNVVPVTGFFRKGMGFQTEVATANLVFGQGIAVRLSKDDLDRRSFAKELFDLLKILRVQPPQVDLVLDFKFLDEASTDPVILLDRIPMIASWRTLTILAGAFPVDLSSLRANNTYVLPRYEWDVWKRTVERRGGREQRLPTFGDYTIQHTVYREPVEFLHVSASIRYATENSWVIMRGEWIGKATGSGSAQYAAEAQLLIERPEYCGEDFSFGDGFIASKARNGSKPGNPMQWLLAGINHHITLTATMIQKGRLPITREITAIPSAANVANLATQ
jgi:hypothetical protein